MDRKIQISGENFLHLHLHRRYGEPKQFFNLSIFYILVFGSITSVKYRSIINSKNIKRDENKLFFIFIWSRNHKIIHLTKIDSNDWNNSAVFSKVFIFKSTPNIQTYHAKKLLSQVFREREKSQNIFTFISREVGSPKIKIKLNLL